MVRWGVKELPGNLEKALFWMFLLLIPSQIGKHFWPSWSSVWGIRVDYLSPTVYLLDLVWTVGFLLCLVRFLSKKREYRINFKYLGFGGAGLFFVLINIFQASNSWAAFYKWIRLFQWFLTFLYLQKNKYELKNKLPVVISCWTLLEVFLALAQTFLGRSMNGIFYWLGERSFNFNTIGIAQISVLGHGLLRAYGTFSHPNSLAGFFLVCLLIWFDLAKPVSSKAVQFGFYRKTWWWLVVWLLNLGIIVCGSRLVWLLALLSWVIFFYLNNKNKKIVFGSVLILSGLFFGSLALINFRYPINQFVGGWDPNDVEKRLFLSQAAWAMIKDKPFFGVGLNNFLVNLPTYERNNQFFWLQPVHNLLLLLWAEFGTIGILFLSSLVFRLKNWRLSQQKIILLLVILASSMWDHYWFTLPQNFWLLAVVFAYI